MKVLHLASVNRWTGAAGPAYAEVEALREAGVDAHFACVGGYKLEAKFRDRGFVHPVLLNSQDPISFARTALRIRRLVARLGIDLLHAHLTHDHMIAIAASTGTPARIVRTFHSRRTLRDDPFSRALLRRTGALAFINRDYEGVYTDRAPIFTPPPLNTGEFRPDGDDARAMYGIPRDAVVVGAIGKIVAGRGFEDVLRCIAIFRAEGIPVTGLIVGEGPHDVRLKELAAELGIANAVVWAGYHETLLASHYRAMDVLLFTAIGSDEGHRAVIEAQGCGVGVAAYPLPGMTALVLSEWIAAAATPESLAAAARGVVSMAPGARNGIATRAAAEFGYPRAAERLLALYARVETGPKLA